MAAAACLLNSTNTATSSGTDAMCFLQGSVSPEQACGEAPMAVSISAVLPAGAQRQLQDDGPGEQARAQAPATLSALGAPAGGRRHVHPSALRAAPWRPPSLDAKKLRELASVPGNHHLLRSADLRLVELLLQPQPPRAWYQAAKVLSALATARMQPTLECQQRVAGWLAAGGPEGSGSVHQGEDNLPWCQRTVLQAWAALAMRSRKSVAQRTLPMVVHMLRQPLSLAPGGHEGAVEDYVRMTFAMEVGAARSMAAVEDAVHGARAFLNHRNICQAFHALTRLMPHRRAGKAADVCAVRAPTPPRSDEQPAPGGECAPEPDGGATARTGPWPEPLGAKKRTLRLLVGSATAWLASLPASQAPGPVLGAVAQLMDESHRLPLYGPQLNGFLRCSCSWLAAADWDALMRTAGEAGARHAALILRAWASGWVPGLLPPPPPQAVLGLAKLATSAGASRGPAAFLGTPSLLLYWISYLVRAHQGMAGKIPAKVDPAAMVSGRGAQRTISRGLAGRLDAVAVAALRSAPAQTPARTAERVVRVAGALLAVMYRPRVEVAHEFMARAGPLAAHMSGQHVTIACRALWKWHKLFGLAYERAALEAFAASVAALGQRVDPRAQAWLRELLASNAPGVSGEVQEPADSPGVSGEAQEPAEVSGEVLEPAESSCVAGECQENPDLAGVSGEVQESARTAGDQLCVPQAAPHLS